MGKPNDHLPTGAARRSLAARFRLPYSDDLQDWEWEVAMPERFDEFLGVYANEILTAAERFSLMEILLQCVEESDTPAQMQARWKKLMPHLAANLELHEQTIDYWSCLEARAPEECFRITPNVRSLHPVPPEQE